MKGRRSLYMKLQSSGRLSSVGLLIRGINYVPGELKLADGHLSFTAQGSGTLWKLQLNKLERDAHRPGLADRMHGGEISLVFKLRTTDVEIDLPWYCPDCLRVRVGGVRFLICIGKPMSPELTGPDIGTIFEGCVECVKASHLTKAWKNVLSEG